MTEAIPAMLFEEVKGSMTSPDGQHVYLRAETIDGNDMMLGFPHESIGAIMENLAAQLPHGRGSQGEAIMTAFKATGYDIGRSPKGDPVLMLHMGEDVRMNFVLNQEIVGSLVGHLASLMTKNKEPVMPKGGSFEVKPEVKHTVLAAGQEHDLLVQQISSSVWRAAGEFRGRPLIAQGRTEAGAVENWEHIVKMKSDDN